MGKILIGKKLSIHSYKHDGKIHRGWGEAIVLEQTDDYIVCGNDKTNVYEKTGSVWKTKEAAILYFFRNKWFNIIAQLKKDGLYYYCNVATPFIIEEGTIKYIDYDLDLRVFPNKTRKILDEREYAYHRNIMKYDDRLDQVIKKGLQELNEVFVKEVDLISAEKVKEYHEKYLNLKKNKN